MKNKKPDFVFSSRNPIATVSPIIYGILLIDEEDFEKPYVKATYLELAQQFEDNLRYQANMSSMFD